jgi:hypothetical protein
LQQQDDHHVKRGDDTAPDERDAEEKLQADGRADDFSQITGGDGGLAQRPEAPDNRLRIMITASLGKIASGGDA